MRSWHKRLVENHPAKYPRSLRRQRELITFLCQRTTHQALQYEKDENRVCGGSKTFVIEESRRDRPGSQGLLPFLVRDDTAASARAPEATKDPADRRAEPDEQGCDRAYGHPDRISVLRRVAFVLKLFPHHTEQYPTSAKVSSEGR